MAIENQFEEGSESEEISVDGDLQGSGLDSRKIILMVVLPLFILIGIGAGLYFTGTFDKMIGGGAETEHASGDGHGGGAPATNAYFVSIPNMMVNLNGPENQPRYLRLSVQLELSSASDQVAVEAVMPRVIDQFQTYLRELRVKDLRGSKGLYRLQIELLNRVNAAAYPIEVKDVLFQEILIN